MKPLYFRLNERRKQIRLLRILPYTYSSRIIHCTLDTHSLDDYSAEYTAFLSSLDSSPTTTTDDRRVKKQWTDRRLSPEIAGLEAIRRVNSTQPVSTLHRFAWGDFAALSYVWGDQTEQRAILVNGQEVRITANLERALRNFQENTEFEGRFQLWVDALCINQQDLYERAQQVQRMREVYGSAWSVVAWLGGEEKRSSAAFQLLSDFVSFGEAGQISIVKEKLRQDPQFLGTGRWLALLELMERPYWYRLWIIQELVMGGAGTVLRCGSASIEWTTFCTGVTILEEHLWLVKDECLRHDIIAAEVDHDPIWSTASLHLVYQDLSLLSTHSTGGENGLSFGRLLDMAVLAHCSDHRDKVFGLIGLMPSSVARNLRPDYTVSSSAAFTTTTRAFIHYYDNLDPLREGNPWGPAKAPSWVADWLWLGRVRWARVEGPLWGPAALFPQERSIKADFLPYCASGRKKHDVAFSDDGLLLSCTGFIVDSITGLSARSVRYFSWSKESIVKPQDWTSIYGDFTATAEALARTLVADRVAGGKRASARHSVILSLPSTFKTAGRLFAERGWSWLAGQKSYYFRWEEFRAVNRDFPLGEHVLDDFFTDRIHQDGTEYDFTEVYSCFDRSSQKRRLITTQGGYIGWAPDNIFGEDDAQTRYGDLIAIVFGCSTPLVIRPHGQYYQVLGEAYVHGLMDGEAIHTLEEGKYQTQQFVFC